MSEYTKEEIAAMREKGKELKIGNYHNMKPENLAVEIKKAEDVPAGLGDTPEKAPPENDRLAALEKDMLNLKEENETLKIMVKSTPYDKKDEGDGPGNPNKILYKDGGHKQFHPAEVKKAIKDGWSDKPDESAIRTMDKE